MKQTTVNAIVRRKKENMYTPGGGMLIQIQRI